MLFATTGLDSFSNEKRSIVLGACCSCRYVLDGVSVGWLRGYDLACSYLLVTDLLKGNFQPQRQVTSPDDDQDERAAFRKKAIESISGSMVFVDDKLLYWDIADE